LDAFLAHGVRYNPVTEREQPARWLLLLLLLPLKGERSATAI